ncbi:universal stress protein [Flexithrix dorotheae]|uniref:universal stress protein n=1 Tax=Flexithrix dorotheae TaxID=70993 RepID=UPI00035E16BD|nr:universal stress protein [Flexithrix dorotheae]
MPNFKRIMVALDNTYFDREVISFANYISELVSPEKVYFVHIDRDLEVPDYLNHQQREDTGVLIPKDEQLKIDIQKVVKQHFHNHTRVSIKVEIKEGTPLKELLHLSKVKHTDLIIVGHKKLSDGSGITANKLAREADCSILFVPEGQELPIKNMIVPFDFSGNSDHALKTGLTLNRKLADSEITVVHVYDVPLFSNYEINVNYEEMVKNVLNFKKSSFREYLEKQGFENAGIKVKFLANTSGRTVKYINDFILENKPGLVIIGAKGHSSWDAFLLGSVTEKLLSLNAITPILVERNYSHN